MVIPLVSAPPTGATLEVIRHFLAALNEVRAILFVTMPVKPPLARHPSRFRFHPAQVVPAYISASQANAP